MLGIIVGIGLVAVILFLFVYYWGYLPHQKVGSLKIKITDHYLNSGSTFCNARVLQVIEGNTYGIKKGDTIYYPSSTNYVCSVPIGEIITVSTYANGEIR